MTKEIVKRKQKTISERLIEVREFAGLSTEEMAFLLSMKEQIYKDYERGAFDESYSIRHDRIIATLVYLDDEFAEKIELLQKARQQFKNYGKRNPKKPNTHHGNGSQKPRKANGVSPSKQ